MNAAEGVDALADLGLQHAGLEPLDELCRHHRGQTDVHRAEVAGEGGSLREESGGVRVAPGILLKIPVLNPQPDDVTSITSILHAVAKAGCLLYEAAPDAVQLV